MLKPTPPAPVGTPPPKRRGFLQMLKDGVQKVKDGVQKVKDAFTLPAPLVGGRKRSTAGVKGKATPYTVKMKLGKSFMTRQLSKNTRAARIASLSSEEYDIARMMGWIGHKGRRS